MRLKLDNVSKTYLRGRRDVAALAGASLEIFQGDFVALYGPSRSGKTTLLRIAAGLEDPDSGSVFYDGRNLKEMSDRELTDYRRSEIGCVWSRHDDSLGLAVLEAVALPLVLETGDWKQSKKTAQRFLDAVGADQCSEAAIHELSDGERRRVAIARAIVNKPKLLLTDEPTAHLGPIERDSILELLQSLASEANIAVLMTGTHTLEVLRANHILGMDEGHLTGGRLLSEVGQLIELPSRRVN